MKEVHELYRAAKEYIAFISSGTITMSDLEKLTILLAELYIAEVKLASTEYNGDVSEGYDPVSLPRPEVVFDEGFKTLYWSVFDPYSKKPEEEVCCMDLKDDLEDIAADLLAGISAYEDNRIKSAALEWRTLFDPHTGDHIVNAIKALQALRNQ